MTHREGVAASVAEGCAVEQARVFFQYSSHCYSTMIDAVGLSVCIELVIHS